MAAGEKKTTAIGIAAIIVTIGMLLIAFSAPSDKSSIQQVGYLKSETRARVMFCKSSEVVSETQARELLEQLSWTPGHATVAVIYEGDAMAPKSGVALLDSCLEAVAVFSEPPFDRWTWHLGVNPIGTRMLNKQDCPVEIGLPRDEMRNVFMEDPS